MTVADHPKREQRIELEAELLVILRILSYAFGENESCGEFFYKPA